MMISLVEDLRLLLVDEDYWYFSCKLDIKKILIYLNFVGDEFEVDMFLLCFSEIIWGIFLVSCG